MQNNKMLKFTTKFDVVEKKASAPTVEDTNYVEIEGYANFASVDRSGDMILPSAWNNLSAYLANPIVLAYHNHSKPIGSATEVYADTQGLKIRAKIFKSAGEIYEMVKEGVLRAFSVGFIVKDYKYDDKADIFIITDAELWEVSVVSIPDNRDSLFSLAKSFDSEEEFNNFKANLRSKQVNQPEQVQEKQESRFMDEKQILDLLNKAVADAVTTAVTNVKQEMSTEKAAEKAAQEKAAAEAKIAADLAAEKAAVQKAAEEKALAEKAAAEAKAEAEAVKQELEAYKTNKMVFADRTEGNLPIEEIEKAVMLGWALKKSARDTKYGATLVQKYGQHVASADWEKTMSTNMQNDIRKRLVVASLFSVVDMPTPVMMLPLNPEAGYATWVATTDYGTTASSGTAAVHALGELTLTSYKLATKEFIGNEEEEDAILALLPRIREAMVRRMAKAWDLAVLRGAGAGANPLKGLTTYQAATSNVTVATTANVTVSNLISLREALGDWGLPSEMSDLVYVISKEVFYALLKDSTFQTMDKVGPRATLLTGMMGEVGGIPVIVSGEFAAQTGGTAGSIGAICVNTRNFIHGNHRGLKVETDYLVEQQSRLLVATQRVAFKQISTANGQGVSALRWT